MHTAGCRDRAAGPWGKATLSHHVRLIQSCPGAGFGAESMQPAAWSGAARLTLRYCATRVGQEVGPCRLQVKRKDVLHLRDLFEGPSDMCCPAPCMDAMSIAASSCASMLPSVGSVLSGHSPLSARSPHMHILGSLGTRRIQARLLHTRSWAFQAGRGQRFST